MSSSEFEAFLAALGTISYDPVKAEVEADVEVGVEPETVPASQSASQSQSQPQSQSQSQPQSQSAAQSQSQPQSQSASQSQSQPQSQSASQSQSQPQSQSAAQSQSQPQSQSAAQSQSQPQSQPSQRQTDLKRKLSSSDSNQEPEGGSGAKKARITEASKTSAFTEPIFDKPPPQRIGFLDMQRLEYATKAVQKGIQLILTQAPTYNELAYLLNSPELDSGTRSELQQGDLISLASKLKSKYKLGKLPVLDDILNGVIVLTKEELEASARSEPKIAAQNVQLNLPFNNAVNEISPNGVKNDLPPLPVINDTTLYEKVFVHKSTVNNKTYLGSEALIHKHNERLEFFGDSIFNNLITLIIYEKFPNCSEGDLSKIRAALVNNRVLKQIAIDYGFDKKLRTRIPEGTLSNGEQKIYADVFEAYVGALGIERKFDLQEVKDWLENLYENRIIELQSEFIKDPLDRDAKTELYSKIGTADVHPNYKVVTVGDGVHVEYVVECTIKGEFLGRGSAAGAKEASLRAAMAALDNTAVLEKYYLERKKVEKPIKIARRERNEVKNKEKLKKLQETKDNGESKSDPDFKPASPIRTSMFPVPVNYDDEVDWDAKNQLYALIGKETATRPEYVIAATDNNKHTVHLRIRNLNVATASDTSKKKAMSRCASAVWKNKDALRELCKRFEPKDSEGS
ncbi:uncharacterized protein LODBEIA_P52660 [Lodderomyces beijingensis]|uniref:Uncharacterized protein n=1 Tax=Lodderomyces beijingensis TaxID=1775926 RepID=A0ABP0ZW43_9ASCO